ncbi:hypothetical protein K435DRAFT_809131 [Dendrothele bispora CBS 962.96]|uniref:Uncharacterized protein n=1 Tax=Dendrothele bispora (strain CBS 962.96) TaxID=1314807 RepID=A0A4V4HC04_DENBC|nr:hypothetical protein K435DRAFT_809131 [Dendrothele bispora CBS 962.96]
MYRGGGPSSRRSVRNSCLRAVVDFDVSFNKQSTEVVANVAHDDPYFSKARFPGYSPILEYMKLVIKNKRKYLKKASTKAMVRNNIDSGDEEDDAGASTGGDMDHSLFPDPAIKCDTIKGKVGRRYFAGIY